jgi:hypothetical protein
VHITREQMHLLDALAFEAFVDRLARFVRCHCGGANAFAPGLVPADDVRLRQAVLACAVRARVHGLEGERAVATFVCLAFSYAPDFDSIPGVGALLEERGLPPDQRIRRVFAAIVRAEARRQSPARGRG